MVKRRCSVCGSPVFYQGDSFLVTNGERVYFCWSNSCQYIKRTFRDKEIEFKVMIQEEVLKMLGDWTCVCGRQFNSAKERYAHFLICDIADKYITAHFKRGIGEPLSDYELTLLRREVMENRDEVWRLKHGITDLTPEEQEEIRLRVITGLLEEIKRSHPYPEMN